MIFVNKLQKQFEKCVYFSIHTYIPFIHTFPYWGNDTYQSRVKRTESREKTKTSIAVRQTVP